MAHHDADGAGAIHTIRIAAVRCQTTYCNLNVRIGGSHRRISDHEINWIDELLPWNYLAGGECNAIA
jgi:hypothetical protein